MRRPSLLIIFLTVLIDLIGFGIVLPLLPIFAKNFNAGGMTIGLLMASFSAMQFVFSPIWGRLSDRVGRRPVLLISSGCAALSYALLAIGCSLTSQWGLALIFVSRVFAGICGANITVAQAYIADITPPNERSKGMGMIGVAFGLGFILGPVLGGLGLHLWGPTAPGWLATAFCAGNFIFAWMVLPESRKPSSETVPPRPHLEQFLRTLREPQVGLLVGLFFVATFIFSSFETTLGLLVSQNFHLKLTDGHGGAGFDSKIAYLYAFCGIVGVLVQGGAIGRAVKRFGEPAVIILSFLLVALSMGPMPYVSLNHFGWTGLLVLLGILSIGSALARPPIFGMISMLSHAGEQGASLGVAQSAGSLARIVGPIFAAVLFEKSFALPYVLCAAASLVTGFVALRWLRPGQSSQELPSQSTQTMAGDVKPQTISKTVAQTD